MKNANILKPSSPGPVNNLWGNIVVIFKAISLGFVVNVVGVGSWVLVLIVIPPPWYVFVMALLLLVYWQFFSGKWGPKSTSEFRRNRFRNVRLSPVMWQWGIVAAILFILAFQAGVVVTFRIYHFPEDLFKSAYNYDALPVWMAWFTIIMASLVAGICEETGFRGYMQTILEKHFSPQISIFIVSAVFLLVHLHQAWAPPLYLHIFVASILGGYLAFATGSIVPGVIGHFLLDVINFSYWWSDLAGQFKRKTISETGVDLHFLTWFLVLALSLIFFSMVIKRIVKIREAS